MNEEHNKLKNIKNQRFDVSLPHTVYESDGVLFNVVLYIVFRNGYIAL